MANYYGPPPGAYGARQNSYGAAPGQAGYGAPPGFGAPPGMPPQSPAGMPGQFPPNFDPNANVIRFGVDGRPTGPAADRMSGSSGGDHRGDRGGRGDQGRSRPGLGADGRDRNIERDRQQVRESMMALQPPTREELARTIFVGGLAQGAPDDDALEALLRCAGKLRRWTRARDADDKKCKFGFAEYEDVDSLEAAFEIYRDIEVPLFNTNGTVQKDDDGEVKKMKLLVVVDEASQKYIEEWTARRKEDENTRQFRLDTAKEELQSTLANIANAAAAHSVNGVNGDGDIAMGDANGEDVETVNITGTAEDDLADIPAEQRPIVAQEIKAFRDRSNRRDIERARREEDLEKEERARAGGRTNRLASPPPNGAPSGPAGGANGIPVGPRGQHGVQGAPAGPKGYRGAQLPSDYANGVVFVPGAGRGGREMRITLDHDDEDAEESDEELERRKQEKKNAELDREYQTQVKRWQGRERQRGMAKEREKTRENAERRQLERAKDDMLQRLAKWNDDEEAEKGKEIYYRDRSIWLRNREYERERERKDDDLDRKQEEREKADERRRTADARGQADDFLSSMGIDVTQPGAPTPAVGAGPVKISLGGAAKARNQPTATAANARRGLGDVEGLLEDEEDAAAAGHKRPELKPLQDTSTLPVNGQDLTDEEKASARQQLASEIPTETDALFAHPIKWDSLTSSLLDAQIRPFVERKVVEYLGVQEDLLVDAVMDGIKDRKSPTTIKDELEGPLEDEAEVMVKKVWRLLVFWGECENRGLGA